MSGGGQWEFVRPAGPTAAREILWTSIVRDPVLERWIGFDPHIFHDQRSEVKQVNLGELREAIEGLPDDTDVVLDAGDLYFYEARVDRILPPVLDHPYCFGLVMGQPINEDLDMDARIDASHL